MAGVSIEEGKVYLRDTRNGNIHPYEHLLSQMPYMLKFIGGKKGDEVPEDVRPQPPMAHMTSQERAAEYDKRARMSNEEREEYDAKQEAARTNQKQIDSVPVGPPKKKFALTAKAAGASMASFMEKGWTIPMMVQEGMLEEIADGKADVEADV